MVSSLSTCNIISNNGNNIAKGRQPKTGYYTSNWTTNNSTTITDVNNINSVKITGGIGAQVVVRELMYELNSHDISSVSGNTITFSAGSIPGTPW